MDTKVFRAILLHEFKLGHETREATRNIQQAWGEDTANERPVERWFAKFRSNLSLEDKERSGRPYSFDADCLKDSVEADPRKKKTTTVQ